MKQHLSIHPIFLVFITLTGLLMGNSAFAQVFIGSNVGESQTHAWASYKNSNDEIVMVHLPPRDGAIQGAISIDPAEPGEAHAVRSLNTYPEAIVGIDDRVYLVFPSTYTQGRQIRRVFSGRAVASPMGSAWGFMPNSRLKSESAITTAGALNALVATSDALWALIKDADKFTLLIKADSAWEQVELPSHIAESSDWTISAAGAQLIAIDLSDPDTMSLYGFDQETRLFSAMDWPTAMVPAGDFEILANQRGMILVDRNENEQVRIRIWSQGGVFTIADHLDIPAETKFTVLGSVNRLVGISNQSNPPIAQAESGQTTSSVQMYEIDLSDGSLVYVGDPVATSPVDADEFKFMMGMMILIMGGVLVVVILPDRADALGIPEGFELADPGKRLLATMVDVILVSLMMGILFDVRVIEIITLSVIARPDGAWFVIPSVMISGITIMSVMEWLLGASPGKFFVGIRVVRAHSGPMQRVPFWASLVRNVIKWILPPVAALALVDPAMLHRGDRATCTIVAAPIEPTNEGDASDPEN